MVPLCAGIPDDPLLRGQQEANAVFRAFGDTAFSGDRYTADLNLKAVQAVPTYKRIVVSGISDGRLRPR